MSTPPPEQTSASVVVVDYGLGNLRSVTRGLERANAEVSVVDDPAALDDADGIVLPGVGAFGDGMENAGPFRDALVDAAEEAARCSASVSGCRCCSPRARRQNGRGRATPAAST